MTSKLLQTQQEKYAAANDELVHAQFAFRLANQNLKRFDAENPVQTLAVLKRRGGLQILYEQALANLREKEQVQRFMHHELFAMDQGWGRSPGKWFRGDRKYEERR